LVPIFVDQRDRDDDEGTSTVISVAAVVLVAVTVAGMLAAPVVVRLYTLSLSGAEAAAQEDVAVDLLRLFMPQMLFYGLTALATAMLHAHRRFAAPAFTPVLNNLLVIGIFLAIPHVAGHAPTLNEVRGDTGLLLLLGLGTTGGIVLMALALLPAVRGTGVRLRFNFDCRHPAVRKVVALSGWTAGYVAANQVALWIVLVLANDTAGGVSAYQGAFMFFQLPHGLVAVSLMTTIVPELASAAGRGEMVAFRRQFASGLRLMVFVILPAAAGYLVMSRPIVSFLLDRGAFTEGSVGVTASCLAAFALGLVPFSVYLYALRGFYAFQDTRTPFFLNLVENALNIAFAFVLEAWLGVKGLALAYSLAYAVAAVLAMRALDRRAAVAGGRSVPPLWGAAVQRMVAAALGMALAVWVVVRALPASAPALAEVAAGLAVGVVAYGAGLVALTEVSRRVGGTSKAKTQ
jgi:putative peptidoglycan lipid II flippase